MIENNGSVNESPSHKQPFSASLSVFELAPNATGILHGIWLPLISGLCGK